MAILSHKHTTNKCINDYTQNNIWHIYTTWLYSIKIRFHNSHNFGRYTDYEKENGWKHYLWQENVICNNFQLKYNLNLIWNKWHCSYGYKERRIKHSTIKFKYTHFNTLDKIPIQRESLSRWYLSEFIHKADMSHWISFLD